MNALEKIRALEGSASPLFTDVEIEVGGQTQTFRFRRLPFLEARRIDNIPMKVFRTEEKDEHGNFKVDTAFDVTKVPERDAEIIAASLVDDDGRPALTIAQVKELHPDLGPKILEAAKKVNAKHDEAIADATKNSAATGADGSSIASPGTSDAQSPSSNNA